MKIKEATVNDDLVIELMVSLLVSFTALHNCWQLLYNSLKLFCFCLFLHRIKYLKNLLRSRSMELARNKDINERRVYSAYRYLLCALPNKRTAVTA